MNGLRSIAIVGEAWGEKEERAGKPFVGASGYLLDQLLALAGIDRRACLVTNTFNLRPPGNNVLRLCGPKTTGIPGYPALQSGKYVRAEFEPELTRLHNELVTANPNVIIALGNTALWALTRKTGIQRYRGTPLPAADLPYKILPTFHPAAVLREWPLRSIVALDLKKAARESASPAIRRPSRKIWLNPTLADLAEFKSAHIDPAAEISVDIETASRSITEIGFAPTNSCALVVPFYSRSAPDGNYWATAAEERAAWEWVRTVLAEKPVYGQNFSYDMIYLLSTMGIPCPHFCDDTMILHHALQPELKKSLGFLGSIYTDEPAWKFMRTDIKTLKTED